MRKSNVLISIETFASTDGRDFGREFMRCLLDTDTRLAPELVSTSETFKDPFVTLDDFLASWWAMPAQLRVDGSLVSESFWGPMWKRKSPLASRGMVNHGAINQKGQRFPSTLWFEARWHSSVEFERLFDRWVALCRPNVAMLHLFTDKEPQSGGASSSFAAGSFGGPAKPGLPNIGWAMAYGEEYASEVDQAKIKAAGYSVKMNDGIATVQVTETLSDVVHDFSRFSRQRSALKGMFRPGLFWIGDEPTPGAAEV